jgi:hypothetical protein
MVAMMIVGTISYKELRISPLGHRRQPCCLIGVAAFCALKCVGGRRQFQRQASAVRNVLLANVDRPAIQVLAAWARDCWALLVHILESAYFRDRGTIGTGSEPCAAPADALESTG